MYDLYRFTLREMTECGAALRRLGAGAKTTEETAGKIVRYLYDHLLDRQMGERACVLVRFFKTHPFEGLDPQLRRFALNILAQPPESPGMTCLTLLATAGVRPEWNSRECSVGHQAIPLTSTEMIQRAPMVSQLIQQLGLEVTTVLRPDPALVVDFAQRTFNVFHVPEAVGNPYIPAQEEFVVPFGVRSVLGFGGILASGNLFAIILFSKVHIAHETADLFKPLALSAKLAVLPFAEDRTFA
jgi:hypothetical protein